MLLKKNQSKAPVADAMTVEDAMEKIAHPEAAQRREAAVTLHGEEGAVDVLADCLRHEERQSVRGAAVSSMIAIGSDDVVDFFIEQLRGDEADRRNEAVYALQQLPEQSSQKIQSLLSESEPDMRIMAVDVIRLLTIPEAHLWLRALLSREDHPNVIGVAVDRLCEIGSVDDLPTLEEIKARFVHDPYIQFAIDHAIKRIICLDAEEPI